MEPGLADVGFTWRACADAARIHALHLSVLARTPAGMMRADSLAHFDAHAGPAGRILGCFLDDGTLAAYGVLGLDSPTVHHLAALLGTDPLRFAVLDGAAALPEWRGHGLHRHAIGQRIAHARALGRMAIGATVAPANVRSVRGLLAAGLQVRRFAMLYGGLARLVLLRDLECGDPPRHAELSVAVADHAAHGAALAAGLAGYACRQGPCGQWLVDYGRLP